MPNYTHIEICKKALEEDKYFNTFKTEPMYQRILEHTSERYGKEYVKLISTNFKEYTKKLDWERLKENDSIGGANVIDFPELKEFTNNTNYSPSTVYYIYRGLDIIDRFLVNNEPINLLEIGGGYGGQCKILLDMCDMLGITVSSYGIVDLDFASRLQKKYLNNFGHTNVDFHEYGNIDDFSVFDKYNKFISNYALTEFETPIQNYYIDNVIKNVGSYYVLCNAEMKQDYFSNSKVFDALPHVSNGIYHKILIK